MKFKIGDKVVPRDREEMWEEAVSVGADTIGIKRYIKESKFLEIYQIKDIYVRFEHEGLTWSVYPGTLKKYNEELEGIEL